jgi:regulator of sigma D
LSIENVRDLEDYLKTLLDFNNARHRQFYEELLKKRLAGN